MTTMEWVGLVAAYLFVCGIYWRFARAIATTLLWIITAPFMPGAFLVNFLAGVLFGERDAGE